MFSLELPHRGDSYMSSHNIPYQYKKENHPKLSQYNMSSAMFFVVVVGDLRSVRNSRGKRAISV